MHTAECMEKKYAARQTHRYTCISVDHVSVKLLRGSTSQTGHYLGEGSDATQKNHFFG